MILLATVESVFSVSGRGTVIVPAFLSNRRAHRGESIQLRRLHGEVIETSVLGIESLSCGSGKRRPAFMLPHGIAKEDIPEGTEIWLAETQEEVEAL